MTSDTPTTATDTDLRILEVVPPDHSDSALFLGADGTYTVLLRLSRVTTATERHQAVRLAGDDIRLFGSTMTLSHTTLERVAETRHELATLLAEIERSAAASDAGHAEAAARVREQEDTEVERRTALARSISFDPGAPSA